MLKHLWCLAAKKVDARTNVGRDLQPQLGAHSSSHPPARDRMCVWLQALIMLTDEGPLRALQPLPLTTGPPRFAVAACVRRAQQRARWRRRGERRPGVPPRNNAGGQQRRSPNAPPEAGIRPYMAPALNEQGLQPRAAAGSAGDGNWRAVCFFGSHPVSGVVCPILRATPRSFPRPLHLSMTTWDTRHAPGGWSRSRCPP